MAGTIGCLNVPVHGPFFETRPEFGQELGNISVIHNSKYNLSELTIFHYLYRDTYLFSNSLNKHLLQTSPCVWRKETADNTVLLWLTFYHHR